MGIEYDGRKPFSKPRKLVELGSLEQFQDKLNTEVFGDDEREGVVDDIYTGLAKTYLKGKVLKEGLSKMDPAQFIPIEEFAEETSAAANRLAKENSKEGTVITYSLYQKAIEIILDKKWSLRATVINMRVPASSSQTSKETAEKLSNSKDVGGMLGEFISQNGLITTIIGMLTISPFQTVIFQALGVEQGAKGIQLAQIPAGIAFFLELGIKAERLLSILKDSNLATPLVEQQVQTLSSSETARADAMSEIGINYDDFKRSQEFQDAEKITKYVSEYYTRYGGLDRPGGHLSIDHWIAYQHTAQNQQTIRGALNASSDFSPKFQSFKEQFGDTPEDQEQQNIFTQDDKKTSKIFLQLASATRALKESSDSIYDDMISAFNYQLTDRDLCCLVQIFGKIGNPDLMYTIASMLRILATNLGGEIVRIENLVSRFLANLAQDALFEIMGKVNKFYYKVAHKITKAFTTDFENLKSCNGMFTLGWALTHSVRVIFNQVDDLLKEISSIIGDFGTNRSGSWTISADRRHLLGVARLLEVLSGRLELANNCELNTTPAGNINITQVSDDSRDVDQALFSILEQVPPNLVISDEDRQKHFADLPAYTSDNLKFAFGTSPEQINETQEDNNCYSPETQQSIDTLLGNIQTALNETFNG